MNAYKRRDEFIHLMPDYTLNSDWNSRHRMEQDGFFTKEEVYKRIAAASLTQNGGNDGCIMAVVCLDTTQAYEEALGRYEVILIDDVRALAQKGFDRTRKINFILVTGGEALWL